MPVRRREALHPRGVAGAELSKRSERVGVSVKAKRVYEAAAPSDGSRVLIDHIWPRGISKQAAELEEWAKHLAPSGELRKWFGHDPQRFGEFRVRYRKELREQPQELARLREMAERGTLTVLYAARDEDHNNAVVLCELLRESAAARG